MRSRPSGETTRSEILGILSPFQASSSFPARSHVKMQFSGTELAQSTLSELGNHAHVLMMRVSESEKVVKHVPVLTSHSFKVSGVPHVRSMVSLGLQERNEIGFL